MQRPCAILGVATALALFFGSRHAPTPAAINELPKPARLDMPYLGTASCASTACHHQPGPPGRKGCEYTTWINRDKHAHAYDVLLDVRSRWIEKNYRQLADVRDAHPEQDGLCLRCHAAAPAAPLLLRDGISCERCHGPAQRWLSQHYLPDWQRKSDADKAALGMYPTKDLVARARLCVSCHVGSADADVNHDLLGAGHPRISNFEFTNHLAMMPAHWTEQSETARHADFEARAWIIGQLVTARAALELLEARARPAADHPWPEFAEYDCYACHHDLREPSWRQNRAHYGKRLPGSLPWNTWTFTVLPFALDGPAPAGLNEIRQLMGKAYLDRDRVAQQARAAADQLGQSLEHVTRTKYDDPTALHQRLARLAATERDQATASWDAATQRYLAITAIYRTLADRDPKRRNPRITDSLRAMHRSLDFAGGAISPPRFDPVRFGEELEKIRGQVER